MHINEENSLKSQIVTSNSRGGRRHFPYAFTEQGIAMLSGVLHSGIAVQMSISIMNTFISSVYIEVKFFDLDKLSVSSRVSVL